MNADPVSDADNDILYPAIIPFLLIHIGCFAAIWTGFTWPAAALCIGLYWVRMFAITAGYHRYFSHRSFATGRVFQFILAVVAQSSAQRSVLWWAANHRHHHQYSDTVHDLHSPRHSGFVFSHVGWLFERRNDTADLSRIPDFARYPELRLLHRFELAPPALLALLCFLIAGWPGLVIGFGWSTVLTWHATFCINSLAHVRGRKRYVTGDDSRNNWLLALVTMGEGWHNNHHAWPASARQGFRRREIDVSYYAIRLLAALRVVRDVKVPPARVLRGEQQLGVSIIERTAAQLAACFEHLPHMPSRSHLVEQARTMFARTPSFDDIVDRAYALLLAAMGTQPARA